MIPLRVSEIIDSTLVNRDKSLLFISLFILLGLAGLDMLSQMVQRFSTIRLAQNIIFDIRQDIYETLQKQELEFYSRESVGQIMARSVEEVFSLRDLLTWSYRIMVLVTFLFIGSIIAMFQISWELALIFIVVPIIMVVFTAKTAGTTANSIG